MKNGRTGSAVKGGETEDPTGLRAIAAARIGLDHLRAARASLKESALLGERYFGGVDLMTELDTALAETGRARYRIGAWIGILEHGSDPE